MTWDEAQSAEVEWWGNCVETYWIEEEQYEIAALIGIDVQEYTLRVEGEIWDIGGGPVSMLLKADGWSRAVVVDPAVYPSWTSLRYRAAGIEVWTIPAELALTAEEPPDEVWIYNTLQHVESPKQIVTLALQAAKAVRLFEWVEQETNECHIHTLHADEIEHWVTEAGGLVDGRSGTLNDTPYYAAVIR